MAKKTLSEFQDTYNTERNTRKKIDAALKSLGNAWEYPAEFARRAGIAGRQLNAQRENYTGFIVQLPRIHTRSQARIAWAGSKKFATLLRQQLNHAATAAIYSPGAQ